MSVYCKCGDIANVFYDDDGYELSEPFCVDCWVSQDEFYEYGDKVEIVEGVGEAESLGKWEYKTDEIKGGYFIGRDNPLEVIYGNIQREKDVKMIVDALNGGSEFEKLKKVWGEYFNFEFSEDGIIEIYSLLFTLKMELDNLSGEMVYHSDNVEDEIENQKTVWGKIWKVLGGGNKNA